MSKRGRVDLAPFVLGALGLLAAAPAADRPWVSSAPVRDANAEVTLAAPSAPVAHPGGELRVAVRFKIDPGWHIYGEDPGDAGMPTRVDWALPEGVTSGPLEWPEPREFQEGPITTKGYEKEVAPEAVLRVASTAPAGEPLVVKATVRWLSCKEVCVPGKAELVLNIPTEKGETT